MPDRPGDRAAPAPSDVPAEWDFYSGLVDDAPASVLLNFWYERHAPLRDASTLYWCDIKMLDPGPHGMGADEEAQELYNITDRIIDAGMTGDLYPVGRLRNHGVWSLFFYGPPGNADLLSAVLKEELSSSPSRRHAVGSKEDPRWSYYFDFLLPDEERRRWMKDGWVVDALVDHGDPLTRPRRVDHWLYFADETARDDCVTATIHEGFALENNLERKGRQPFGAQVFRVDSVQLDDIHEVVMLLVELAKEHDGTYDGWETFVDCPRPVSD